MAREPSGRGPGIPLPRCGHGLPPLCIADRAICPSCRSFWDLAALHLEYRYDGSYPEIRGHYDPAVGRLKVRTLSQHLDAAGIHLEGLNVCEVGFGGGHCLAHMAERARNAVGIESVQENIDHAVSLGLPRISLYHDRDLPERFPFAINLWVFLDSFEHIGNPAEFLAWLAKNSGDSAKVLLIAPDGGSLSARLMGRYWPHRLPDHPFHWTRKGIADLYDRHGFDLVRSFYPWKHVSLGMIFSHARLMAFGGESKAPKSGKSLAQASLRLNAGEMGLLFQKRCA